jgi:DNA invertase Pin-like site-specific DNA recombinase
VAARNGGEPCATWFRVSTTDQETDNQVPDVERLMAHRGYREAEGCRYVVRDSAWEPGPEYRREMARLLRDAHAGKFSVLVTWAADRLSREGIEALLSVVRKLRASGVAVVSVMEPWLDTTNPAVAELLLAIMAWVAEQESQRRSERVRAGMARARAEGKNVGRPAGARDKRPRRRRVANAAA